MSTSVADAPTTPRTNEEVFESKSGLNRQLGKRPIFHEYMISGMAGVAAVCVSHPADSLRARLQLRDELDSHSRRLPLRSLLSNRAVFQGLFSGFVPGALYQHLMNGIRLGWYDRLKNDFPHYDSFALNLFQNIFLAAFTGSVGAFIASPFYLLKTRMQTHLKSETTGNFGYQHNYNGTLQALYQIGKDEGIRGLWRGSSAAILRVSVGSGAQLASYDAAKDLGIKYLGWDPNSKFTVLWSSLSSSVAITTAMNPFDVISTRLYNQPTTPQGKGLYYKGVTDCAFKTFSTEGVFAFFKGWGPHYLRLGPHSIVCFFSLEWMRSTYDKTYNSQ